MDKYLVINLLAQIVVIGVNLVISFFFVPYATEVIGESSYGFVGLANDFVGYAQIITVAINSMAGRFIAIKMFEKRYDEANKYYSSVIISNLVISGVLFVIGLFFVIFIDKLVEVPVSLLTDVRLLFSFIFLNFIITVITSTFSIATFVTNKLYLSNIRNIIAQLLRVAFLFIALNFLRPSVYYIGVAALISTSYLGYCNYRYSKSLTPELEISRRFFDFGYIKTLIGSGIWNTFSKLSSILSNGLDLLITNLFVGPGPMSIVGISKSLSNVILNAIGQIASIFTPELTSKYALGQYDEMKKQLQFSVRLLSIFSTVPITILFAYGRDFYTLWVPSQDAALLHQLTCVGVAAMCLSLPLEPLWNIFTVTNKVKQSSLYLFFNSALTLLIVFVLIRRAPSDVSKMFIVVGVSVCFSIIRSLTFLPMFGARCINAPLTTFYPNIFRNLLSIGVNVGITLFLKRFFTVNSWIILFVSVCATALYTLVIGTFIVTNREDRISVIQKIKTKLAR